MTTQQYRHKVPMQIEDDDVVYKPHSFENEYIGKFTNIKSNPPFGRNMYDVPANDGYAPGWVRTAIDRITREQVIDAASRAVRQRMVEDSLGWISTTSTAANPPKSTPAQVKPKEHQVDIQGVNTERNIEI